MGMDPLELLLGLCCLPIGLAQLDLHLVQIPFHLLLQPESLISAANLSLQGTLQGVYDPLIVALGLLHFLVLLAQLSLDVGLNLVELQLSPEDLALLMLQGTLQEKFLALDDTRSLTKVRATGT